MSRFIFESYTLSDPSGEATFRYRYEDGRRFEETVTFDVEQGYNKEVLDRALFLAFIVIGTSYVKTFLADECVFESGDIDEWQATFMNTVYQEGLSQYAYENNLTRDNLPRFEATVQDTPGAAAYQGEGTLLLQSGGKDSLLLSAVFDKTERPYTPWYVASSGHHPSVLDSLASPLVVSTRTIDRDALENARADGGRNGHVPITYIVQSFALVQAILLRKQEVVTAIAHEGEEPHARIGDLPVTHQWSKTWRAEQLFAEYVERYVATSLHIGSPLRRFSEVRVAELFTIHAWKKYGKAFSSCNHANYLQGADNSQLAWCGACPKCANAYLLFAPFVDAGELKSVFAGHDLFTRELLQETYKGLLGVDGVMKPFECVGEVDELRKAYWLAQEKGGYGTVSFVVPASTYDYHTEYPMQQWAELPPTLIQ